MNRIAKEVGSRAKSFKLVKHDKKLVRTGSYLFGGLYIGLSMPLTAQQQEVWDWTGSLTGPARPGSWA